MLVTPQVALAAALAARVELRWTGPEDCRAEVFAAALERYVRADAAEVTPVTVRVQALDGRWTLELAIAGGGTRHLTAGSCAVVVDAGAFVVAQALGGSVPLPAAPPAVHEEAAPPVEAAEAAAPAAPAALEESVAASATDTPEIAGAPVEAPVVQAEKKDRRLWGAVRVRGGVSGVGLPKLGGVLGLVGSLGGANWRVDVALLSRLPVRVATAEATVDVQLAMWAVGPRGCWLARAGSFEFPLCAGFELGQAIGRSFGLDPDGRDEVLWAAGVVSPGVAWAPRGWFALVLEAEVAALLLRHDWEIRNLPGPVSRLGAADVRGFLGLEFRFGGAKNP